MPVFDYGPDLKDKMFEDFVRWIRAGTISIDEVIDMTIANSQKEAPHIPPVMWDLARAEMRVIRDEAILYVLES